LSKAREYEKLPLAFARKAVIASATITSRKNTIHCLAEVDITVPRSVIADYKSRKGESLSLTAYIVACLSRTVERYPSFNSFIRGNHLIKLLPVNISVLMEREIEGDSAPEPFVVAGCESKSFYDIHREIRETQRRRSGELGGLSGAQWVRLIPRCLLKTFVRWADGNPRMSVRYGKIAVTAVGMFSEEPVWFIPHGSPTVLVSVGGIVKRPVDRDGTVTSREHLCLTVSFDHDIVDGAPAARFMNDFAGEIKGGRLMDGIASK
jgi:pyruvate/2-oxoglutarate dehydrogenase complex dihydrolipoamide acyltransferase (E2) component